MTTFEVGEKVIIVLREGSPRNKRIHGILSLVTAIHQDEEGNDIYEVANQFGLHWFDDTELEATPDAAALRTALAESTELLDALDGGGVYALSTALYKQLRNQLKKNKALLATDTDARESEAGK